MFKTITIMTLIFSSLAVFANTLPSKKLSMQVKDAGVRDVVVNMLESAELKYEVAGSITNEIKVCIEAKDMNWDDAFQAILDQSKLKYNFNKSGKLHVTKR